MQRKYPNLKEGIVDHEGVSYSQPETDDQFLQTVVFGDLIFVDDNLEVWVFSGMCAVVHNQIGILE